MGWTLDLGHITEQRLSLNGVSGDLKLGKDGFYYLEEDPTLRIERIEGASPGKANRRKVVTDRSGTVYQVVDAQGNTLDIAYNEMLNTDPCGAEPPVRESYPHQLRYTTNPSAQDHHAEYGVEFELEVKGYSAAHKGALATAIAASCWKPPRKTAKR